MEPREPFARGWDGAVRTAVTARGAGEPSVFEAVTRQMVETLAEELREIRQRVDGLLWMIGGSILLDIGMRLVGR